MLIPIGLTGPTKSSGRSSSADGPVALGQDVMVGEWSLTHAAWSDRHEHEELNYVVEGELHVTFDEQTFVAGPGDVVIVPAGKRARYAAPAYARMVFIYGPSSDGHASFDTEYVELD